VQKKRSSDSRLPLASGPQLSRPPRDKAIALLKQQHTAIERLRGVHHDSPEFSKWWQLTRTIITNLFGQDSPQITNFTSIDYSLMMCTSDTPDSAWQNAYVDGLNSADAQLLALLAEVETFWPEELKNGLTLVAWEPLTTLFDRFHPVARQIRARHDNRPTLDVTDEYDVQDLLHALLRIYYDDVRAEEWTPSYAGGSSRMDFIISEHGFVVEVKKTRKGMSPKDLGDQLLVDIMRYKEHPQTKCLFCFIYDPDGLFPNPAGIERDLSKSDDGIDVRCFVRPR
jgi:hypothetical protein